MVILSMRGFENALRVGGIKNYSDTHPPFFEDPKIILKEDDSDVSDSKLGDDDGNIFDEPSETRPEWVNADIDIVVHAADGSNSGIKVSVYSVTCSI